jgi:DNA-binding phage protein
VSIDTELLYETIKRKYTITQFAKNIRMTRTGLYKIFNGVSKPNLSTMYEMIDELELTDEQIIKIFFVRGDNNAA